MRSLRIYAAYIPSKRSVVYWTVKKECIAKEIHVFSRSIWFLVDSTVFFRVSVYHASYLETVESLNETFDGR